ncbi:hypothetical protein R1sor_025667 [Riccia sorocarpa]|uniref:Uncharacterized protein n=1 Tax=Riccia sorocarpa TaxID=122646 RepID=A0ABD3GBA8_9MARC
MEAGKSIELISRGMLVALATVFSVTASDHCHFVTVGEDRLIVQIQEAIVPSSPLPYPNDGAETVREAVHGFVLWDKIHCRDVGESDSGKGKNTVLENQDDGGVESGGLSSEEDQIPAEVPVQLLVFENRKTWKGKIVTVLALGCAGSELAMGQIVYPDSSVCINGKPVGEENAGVMITTLSPDIDSQIVQDQLPNYTSDQPHLCSWPIRLLKLQENGWLLGDLYSVYTDADYERPADQVVIGTEKCHYHSAKRKLLSPEEQNLKKMQKKGVAKLTDDSIRETIAKGCGCSNGCWKKWSVEEIRAERKDIYGVKHDQKLDLLFAKIDASKQRKDDMVLFKDGHFVCKKAFYNFHGIAKSSYYAYRNGSQGGAKQGFHGNTGTLKPREKTIHAVSTLKLLLEEMSEPMPHLSFDNKGKNGTDDICHKLPSCYTQKDLYNELRIKIDQTGQETISVAKFYTMWESSFANFSFHKKSAFVVCTSCERYRTLLTRERNVELRKQYKGERETHLQLQMSRRTNYYSHNLLATSEPNLFKSGIHDGMDSNKTSVPKLANNVKALSGVGMPLPVKIAGILNRGSGPPSCAHVCIGGLWKSDPNFTISSMAKYLRDCETFDGDMRGDLAFSTDLEHPLFKSLYNQPIFEKTFLQWKKQVMAFLSELVARGVFKIVIASFFIVGHTHEDVDAFFSKINRALSGKDVSSIPQLLAEVYGAEEKRSLPRFVTEVADYKSHAQPYRQTFKGIRVPVAFKFSMLDNGPIYQYQLTYGDLWLPTFGNTIWKRKDPKSSVDFSVIPPPDREPVDVGMFEKHANTEEISQYLKAYVKHIDSIQEKTDPTSDLHSMDQAIKVYWKNILKLLEEGWSSNKGKPLKEGFWARTNHGTWYKRPSDMGDCTRLEQDLLEREADEERAERERPFVGSTVERGLDSFTPLLDIQVGHMIIIRPADDFEPKNIVWLAKATSVVNRDSDSTFHNHVKVDWYRP